MDIIKKVTHYITNTDLYLVILALLCSAYGMVLIYSPTLNPATALDATTRNLFIQGAAILMGLIPFVIMSLIDLETMSAWWKSIKLSSRRFRSNTQKKLRISLHGIFITRSYL